MEHKTRNTTAENIANCIFISIKFYILFLNKKELMGEVWPDSTLTNLANGEQCASRGLSKFIVPISRTVQPGRNFRLFGFGVSCVCTNIVLPKIGSNDEKSVILDNTQSFFQVRKLLIGCSYYTNQGQCNKGFVAIC